MADIDAVVNEVAKLPFTDSTRMGIAGASYGGYAVNWILGHSNRFKAAVTHDGVFNLESMSMATEELWFTEWEFGGPPWSSKAREQFLQWSPHLFAQNIKTPTLIITNELDFRVPVDQGLQMFTVLRRNGVAAEALVFPDEGHWVLGANNSRAWHEAVFGWMKKYLYVVRSPWSVVRRNRSRQLGEKPALCPFARTSIPLSRATRKRTTDYGHGALLPRHPHAAIRRPHLGLARRPTRAAR